MNLGKISPNVFKESNAVTLAKRVLEKNQNIKTYFNEMDKRANLDGQLTIITNEYEKMTVDVQIKTLPQNYSHTGNNDYYYDCDTKVFNVVKANITLNPVVLLLVDINKQIIFYILITRDYVNELKIDNEHTKRIKFSDKDIFEDKKFKTELYTYNKQLSSDVDIHVNVEALRNELNRQDKKHRNYKNCNDYKDFELVYTRGVVRGYLSNFIYDNAKDHVTHDMCLLCMVDEKGKEEYLQITHYNTDKFIRFKRSKQNLSTVSNEDIINIIYEVAIIYKCLLFFEHGAEPIYIIHGDTSSRISCDIWRLRAEKIEKEW